MLEITNAIVPAALGILGGMVSAWFAARSKAKQIVASFELDQQKKEEQRLDKLKLQYLDPLRASAQTLRDRFIDIRNRRATGDSLLPDLIDQLKANKAGKLPKNASYQLWSQERDYVSWVNSMDILLYRP